jgi:uncharacterized protein
MDSFRSDEVATESTRLDRRGFLRLTGLAGAVTLSEVFLSRTASNAAAPATESPYGPLQSADANGVMLPQGFSSRVLATSGSLVAGTDFLWHGAPDGGSTFPTPDGGWVYVSNSEIANSQGGASALQFNRSGNVVAAYSILLGTNRNCAGGATPWGTWLSCEENGATGLVWECNPLVAGQGILRPELGSFNHEAAAVDPVTQNLYLTEDDPAGRLYKFVPGKRNDLATGALFAANIQNGQLSWVRAAPDKPCRDPRTSAFNGGEGLWIEGRVMYMTTKHDKRVWKVDLAKDRMGVLYDGTSPTATDSPLNAVDNVTVHRPSGAVLVAEDGGNMELCIMTRARLPRKTKAQSTTTEVRIAPFLRFVGHDESEVTGPAFSPDGRRLYVSSQRGTDAKTGITIEVTGPFERLTTSRVLRP